MENTASHPVRNSRPRAHSVQHLLQQLLEVRIRHDRGEELTLTEVTLHLTSGRELSGFLVDIIEGGSGTSVVVQTDATQERPRVVYTDLSKIEAVGFIEKAKPLVKKPELVKKPDAAVARRPKREPAPPVSAEKKKAGGIGA